MGDLDKLIEAVEGGVISRELTSAAFPLKNMTRHGGALRYVLDAFAGSIDAAKALHDALLPGWEWSCFNSGWDFTVCYGCMGRGTYVGFDGCSPTPARAWLIAILKAYRAQQP